VEKEQDRLEQARIAEEQNRRLDAEEKRRADEWAAREARIQNAMGRMAEGVLKRSNEAEKELERRVLRYAQEADRLAEAREKAKKDAARQRDVQIKATLERQLEEKRLAREVEAEANRAYVKQVIARDERDRAEQREKEKRTLAKLQELQRFQLL